MRNCLIIALFALSTSAAHIPEKVADIDSKHIQKYGDQGSRSYDTKYEGSVAYDTIEMSEGEKGNHKKGGYKLGGGEPYLGQDYTRGHNHEYDTYGDDYKSRRNKDNYGGGEEDHRRDRKDDDYRHEDSYDTRDYATESYKNGEYGGGDGSNDDGRYNEGYRNKSRSYANDVSNVGGNRGVNYQDGGRYRGDNYGNGNGGSHYEQSDSSTTYSY